MRSPPPVRNIGAVHVVDELENNTLGHYEFSFVGDVLRKDLRSRE